MTKPFTGKHMAAILFAGFGIVFAVNFSMASLATRGFGGVVVENSYVASQKYNGWLEEARRQKMTGWDAQVTRTDGNRLSVMTQDTPEDVVVTAIARHPLGHEPDQDLTFERVGDNQYVSVDPMGDGRRIVRLHIRSGAQERVIETDVR